jgi:hypothetical protein
MRKLGRWTKEHLTIHRRSPSQSISRAPSTEPPSTVTVHPQGIVTNHCPWIAIDPLVKSCRCLDVHPCHLVSHRHNVVVSLSYDRLVSGHSSRLQVQIHETTPRVDWMEQIGTLKVRLVLAPTYLISSKDQSRLAPPWQGWEPDPDFLYKLNKWNIAHKDDKLPAVLTKVNSILESKTLQAALEFIPNSPFPAKSLVKAMISLFLLGSVSDISSQTPCHLLVLIISHPPRKFRRQSRTSIAFRIRSLLISPTWL